MFILVLSVLMLFGSGLDNLFSRNPRCFADVGRGTKSVVQIATYCRDVAVLVNGKSQYEYPMNVLDGREYDKNLLVTGALKRTSVSAQING